MYNVTTDKKKRELYVGFPRGLTFYKPSLDHSINCKCFKTLAWHTLTRSENKILCPSCSVLRNKKWRLLSLIVDLSLLSDVIYMYTLADLTVYGLIPDIEVDTSDATVDFIYRRIGLLGTSVNRPKRLQIEVLWPPLVRD